MNPKCVAPIVALLLATSACEKKEEAQKATVTTFSGIGVVTEIDTKAGTITISH